MEINWIRKVIVDGDERGAEKILSLALSMGSKTEDVFKEIIAGLREVSDLCAEGKYYLPQVMLASDIARKMISDLKNMEIKTGDLYNKRGGAVLAVVEGDLHEFGKEMFATLLMASGFDVVNMGRNVSAAEIIECVRHCVPDLLVLSASVNGGINEVRKIVEQVNSVPGLEIVCGGAVLSENIAAEIGVIYSNDIFSTIDSIKS